MLSIELTESESATIALSDEQAAALQRAGKRLASDKQWWGAGTEDEEGVRKRSVIECEPAGSAWRVRVRDAVGLVAVEDLQLVVQPKIPRSHLLYLLAESASSNAAAR